MTTLPPPLSPRAPLTRGKVLGRAITLADEQGFASLTMRALGDSLGVQAMSLYNHITNKDDLLDGMVDLVVSEIQVPDESEPWRVAMQKRGISAHQVLILHPWACGLLMSRANVGPAMLRYVDATLGCLRRAGFSLPMTDHAWNAMDSHIYGFTLQKLNFPFQSHEYSAVAASFLPHLSVSQYPSLHALTEHVASGAHDGLHDLEFGLDLILDGLERMLAKG